MSEILNFADWTWKNYPFITKQYEAYLEENQPKDKTPWERFWDNYAKKVGTAKCKTAFKRVPKSKHELLIDHALRYAQATPDKQFRMNPLTYLNGKYYEDEETITAAKERGIKKSRSTESVKRAGENLKGWAEFLDTNKE